MSRKPSHWKAAAHRAIGAALTEAAALGLDRAATIQHVDSAYPFGPRRCWPYQVWLEARRNLLFPDHVPALTWVQRPSEAARLRMAGERDMFDDDPAGQKASES